MHGPKPRSHAIKLNKKVRRLGLKIALSARAAEGKASHLPSLGLKENKKLKWTDVTRVTNILGLRFLHYALEIILLDVGDSCSMVYVCYNDEIFWQECLFPVCGNLRLLPGLYT